MNIVLICDDNYCLPTAVCIKSIIENTTSDGIVNIFVCSFGLKKENICFLENLSINNINVVVKLFRKEDYKDLLVKISQKTHVTPTALIKFELPNIFTNLDTILYLDSDIIIKKDITDIFNINLRDHYLAASYDFWTRINILNYSLFNRSKIGYYFNSGVMLLNLNKMRCDGISSKLWYYKIHKAKSRLMDQESLNAVCGNNAIHLSLIWNFNPAFYKKSLLSEINNVYNVHFSTINELIEDVRIIHYVGKQDKPWVYREAKLRQYWDEPYRKLFVQDLNLKEFKSEPVDLWQSFINKYQIFGFLGSISYIFNKILGRVLL